MEILKLAGLGKENLGRIGEDDPEEIEYQEEIKEKKKKHEQRLDELFYR